MRAPMAVRNPDGTIHALNTGLLAPIGMAVSLAGATLALLATGWPSGTPDGNLVLLGAAPGVALYSYWLVLGEAGLRQAEARQGS